MPPFVPKPRAVRDIEKRLRFVEPEKAAARSQIAAGWADLARLDQDTDTLLALLHAETARRSW